MESQMFSRTKNHIDPKDFEKRVLKAATAWYEALTAYKEDTEDEGLADAYYMAEDDLAQAVEEYERTN